MRSPNFTPEGYYPPSFAAIGSGSAVEKVVEQRWSKLINAQPGDRDLQAGEIVGALLRYFLDGNEPTVGGLPFVLHVTRAGVDLLGYAIRERRAKWRLQALNWDVLGESSSNTAGFPCGTRHPTVPALGTAGSKCEEADLPSKGPVPPALDAGHFSAWLLRESRRVPRGTT
jgi:hypothetical protein